MLLSCMCRLMRPVRERGHLEVALQISIPPLPPTLVFLDGAAHAVIRPVTTIFVLLQTYQQCPLLCCLQGLARNYPRGNKELRGSFFTAHGPQDTMRWFTDHGVELKVAR